MEEDFPRGGREKPSSTKKKEKEEDLPYHVLKKQQKKRANEGASIDDDDFLFGPPKQRKKHKKDKSKHKNDDDGGDDDARFGASNKHSLLPLGGGGVVFKKRATVLGTKRSTEPFIEALGFSRLAKGTKLLGIVREVQEEFVLVSLPNLLTGYVLRTEVSEELVGKERYILYRACVRAHFICWHLTLLSLRKQIQLFSAFLLVRKKCSPLDPMCFFGTSLGRGDSSHHYRNGWEAARWKQQ